MTVEQIGFEIHNRFQCAEHLNPKTHTLLRRWLAQQAGILFTRLRGLWKGCQDVFALLDGLHVPLIALS